MNTNDMLNFLNQMNRKELNDYIDQWCGQDASDGNINSNGLLPVGTYFYVIQYASDREPTISWIYLNY